MSFLMSSHSLNLDVSIRKALLDLTLNGTLEHLGKLCRSLLKRIPMASEGVYRSFFPSSNIGMFGSSR